MKTSKKSLCLEEQPVQWAKGCQRQEKQREKHMSKGQSKDTVIPPMGQDRGSLSRADRQSLKEKPERERVPTDELGEGRGRG